jgi:hypothetical protein
MSKTSIRRLSSKGAREMKHNTKVFDPYINKHMCERRSRIVLPVPKPTKCQISDISNEGPDTQRCSSIAQYKETYKNRYYLVCDNHRNDIQDLERDYQLLRQEQTKVLEYQALEHAAYTDQ